MSVKKKASPASAGAGVVRTRGSGGGRQSKHDSLYDVIRFVRPLHLALARSVDDGLKGTGITMGMRAVLEVVDALGPTTVPDIGRVLALDRQPVQRMVNAAKKLGLVTLVPNPAHKRSSLVTMTPDGDAAFRAVREREQSRLRRIARGMSPEDIAAAVRVLATLTEAFQENGDGHAS